MQEDKQMLCLESPKQFRSLSREARRNAILEDMPRLTNEELAGKYALSDSTVARYRVKYHIPSPVPRKGQVVSQSQEAEIVRLKKEGATYRDISKRTGVNLNRVRTVLAENDLAKPIGKKKKIPQKDVTPENCIPAIIDDSYNSLELTGEDLARYKELRKWKADKARRLEIEFLQNYAIYLAHEENSIY